MIKNQIKFFIGIQLIFFLRIINIITLIRVAHCHTDRIGHLCGNIDNYLSTRNRGEIAIFIKGNFISNSEVLRRWSLVKGIYFVDNIFSWIYGAIYYVDKNSKHLISWERELSPKFHLNAISKMNFIITNSEIKKYQINENYMGDKKVICLHNRDEAYLSNTKGDGNFHKFRNFPFEDFEYTINKLSNYKFVRIGKYVEKKFSGNCLDKTEENSSDYDDLMIIAKSNFIVGCNSGVETISRILKPQVLVNYIPFVK